jgi:hypothetical protein
MDIASILSNPLVDLALIFIDGLLFGLGIKKGIWSVLFIVIAVFLAEYINYSVVPKASLNTFYTDVISHIDYVIKNIESVIPLHDIGAISISLVLFVVGFIIGYLKG